MVADKRRQEAAKVDERGVGRWTRGDESKGKRWPTRQQTRSNNGFGGG